MELEPAEAHGANPTNTTEPPPAPTFASKKIPPRIIQDAVGLAVFSCMRSGLWMSGSGGAGLITARKADGTWSPPSGIILHTAALAFVIGVDIYDCVLVINSVRTLELFTHPRLTLGADVSLTVGPLVDLAATNSDARWKGLNDTVLTYVKARGRHQPVNLEGSLVTERGNENVRFYGGDVGVLDVLAGNIPKDIPEMRPLFEVIKAAEGRSDFDAALMQRLAQQPAPGDALIETPRPSPSSSASLTARTPFGIPDADDPDPFGVIGLEMAGIEIREAGTHLRPTSTQFEFCPSPTSPAFARFSRQSVETYGTRSNRGSCMSSRTHATAGTDAYTQTDAASTADTSFSRTNSVDGGREMVGVLPTVVEPEEIDYTKIDTSVLENLSRSGALEEQEQKQKLRRRSGGGKSETREKQTTTVPTQQQSQQRKTDASPVPAPVAAADERDEDADDEDDDDDEAVIYEVATATQPASVGRTAIRTSQVTQVIHAKGAIVTIPKRIPPPLPARSPARQSRNKGEFGADGAVAGLKSPLRTSVALSSDAAPATPTAAASAGSDTSLTEEFATPPTGLADKQLGGSATMVRNSTGNMQKPSAGQPDRLNVNAARGHQRASSSVYTVYRSDGPTGDRSRYDSSPKRLEEPKPVQAQSVVETVPGSSTATSSAEDDESDKEEPRTPRTESEFIARIGIAGVKRGVVGEGQNMNEGSQMGEEREEDVSVLGGEGVRLVRCGSSGAVVA